MFDERSSFAVPGLWRGQLARIVEGMAAAVEIIDRRQRLSKEVPIKASVSWDVGTLERELADSYCRGWQSRRQTRRRLGESSFRLAGGGSRRDSGFDRGCDE